MWICLNDAFLSIVADRNDPERLLVRARRAGDIERVFPQAEVLVGVGTDYLYRALLPRSTVSEAITARIDSIDYPNFKNSVAERDRHDAYMQFWDVMYRYQQRERATKPTSAV
jgi:hypothetical protein